MCIEQERGRFGFSEVITELVQKLIRRHPSLFAGDGRAVPATADEMLDVWEQVKRAEKGGKTVEAVAKSLPALMRAEKIQSRAEKAGEQFERQSLEQAARELETAPDGQFEQRLGELLFAAVGLARERGASAELALERACERYVEKFAASRQES